MGCVERTESSAKAEKLLSLPLIKDKREEIRDKGIKQVPLGENGI